MSHLRRWPHSALVLACALAAISGCSWLTESTGYKLPDPDLSLDPAALQQPKLIYLCGGWVSGAPPVEENILVDVSFNRPGPEYPDDRPTSAHLAVVRKHGGEVLYQFHFPAVRAWIPSRNIPALSLDVVGVFKVADPRRYDWNAAVGYRLPYSYREGEVRYNELGGRVDYRFDVTNSIAGLLPDRSAVVLRNDPNVTYVESGAPFPYCF